MVLPELQVLKKVNETDGSKVIGLRKQNTSLLCTNIIKTERCTLKTVLLDKKTNLGTYI